MNSIIDKAIEFVKEFFKNDCSGHDYYHTIHVYELAKKIAEKENADIELTSLIALLHDVDDCKLVGEDGKSFKNTKNFLQSNEINEDRINLICGEISKISFKGTGKNTPDTLEGKIAQDADRLDALGAIGIARTFAYGGSRERAMYLPKDDEKYKLSSIAHFYDKLLKLSDLMNTEEAKSIAIQRTQYMKEYLNEFYDELNCII
ncbi:MAG: HD domain-containing protein [Eubacterium sp.]|nr:HD domain-containing protein [Eubacterium sp.]